MSRDTKEFTPPTAAKTARGFRLVVSDTTHFFLSGDEAGVPESIKLDPRWRIFTNMLVEPGVRFMKDADWACEGLTFTPERLTEAKARLGEIETAQHAAQQQADRLDRVAIHYRNLITEWTGQLTAAADAKQADPTVPRTRKDEVATAAAPLTAILSHYAQAQTTARNTTVGQKQKDDSTAKELQRKDLEIRALRGEAIGPDDLQLPATATAARRKGRARSTRR